MVKTNSKAKPADAVDIEPVETIEATEEVSETAEKVVDVPTPKQQAIKTPKKTSRLVPYKEFVLGKGLSRGFLAGFKMYLNGVEYLSEEDWNKTLKEYQNRK